MNTADIIQISVISRSREMRSSLCLGKILGIYIRNFYPELHFDLEQLLDASYNVWHRLSDEEKISLATFLEEISEEQDQVSGRQAVRLSFIPVVLIDVTLDVSEDKNLQWSH